MSQTEPPDEDRQSLPFSPELGKEDYPEVNPQLRDTEGDPFSSVDRDEFMRLISHLATSSSSQQIQIGEEDAVTINPDYLFSSDSSTEIPESWLVSSDEIKSINDSLTTLNSTTTEISEDVSTAQADMWDNRDRIEDLEMMVKNLQEYNMELHIKQENESANRNFSYIMSSFLTGSVALTVLLLPTSIIPQVYRLFIIAGLLVVAIGLFGSGVLDAYRRTNDQKAV